jgi:hypothetical protein
MIRLSALAFGLVLTTATITAQPQKSGTSTTWTGWFSDKQCARITNDTPRPNGTACVKKCLAEGATAVFISEQAKAIYEVREHPTVPEDVGYHVEVTGVIDEEARTIAIASVKRLSEVVPTCAPPPKRDNKQ